MNVHEIAEKYNLPIRKLKKLEADGLLVTTAGDSRPIKMRAYLSSNRPLSVVQLIDLKRDSSGALLARLGGYRIRAEELLAEVGDIASGAHPGGTATSRLYGAAILERPALDALAEWLRETIPPQGCSYHYIATRLLWNVPADQLPRAYKFLPRALINLRALPELAGWSTKEKGEGTRFIRPKPLDL